MKIALYEIDHINRIRDDNKISNLRESSRSQNCLNVGLKRNNKSGFRNVYWHRQSNAWRASFRRNKKSFHVGNFKTKMAAVSALKNKGINE